MFGMTGVFIIPGILYLQALGLETRRSRSRRWASPFIVITVAIAVFMTGREILVVEQVAVSSLALLPMFAGLLFGTRLRHRIPEERFSRVIMIALFLNGLHLMARAVLHEM